MRLVHPLSILLLVAVIAAPAFAQAGANYDLTKVDAPDPVRAGADLAYTIIASNEGPDAAADAAVTDVLPPGTTFQSLAVPAGWNCSTPAVGAAGTVSCTIASFDIGSAFFTLTVRVDPTLAGGTLLTDTADLTSTTPDRRPGDTSGTVTTTVLSPAALAATKAVGGQFFPGGTVTYTVVLTNSSANAQGDNPGDEFTDVLPPELALVGATATAGVALADPATRTVTWNGSLAAGASVTLTVTATVDANAAFGTTVSNQGSLSYDADGDGTNEATGVTDDPATATADDPTAFVVVPRSVLEVPTLDSLGLAALAALLALGGVWRLGFRSRPAPPARRRRGRRR